MNWHATLPWCFGFVLLGCAERSPQGLAPSASTTASSAPVKVSAQRKTTPKALLAADEQACLAGKADACRRMADRYRGYGHPAGCGIERSASELAHGKNVEPLRVRIKRAIEDEANDKESFLVWIGKACDLADSDACIIEGAIRAGRQPSATRDLEAPALRSDPNTSALIGFHAIWAPDKHEKFLAERKQCLVDKVTSCWGLAGQLMRRVELPSRPELDAEWMTKLQAIGDRTLDFEPIFMMLDKHGYPPEALAPLRAHASKTLVQACIEGACVCGRAAQSLPPEDPRLPDLARWGCEDGEAIGCHVLAKLHEEGRGVEKDEVFARSLNELACPPTRAFHSDRFGEFAPGACSRLAEIAEDGAMPPKNRDRAVYYAEYACRAPGSELDHSYCVKLAKYWTAGVLSSTCYEYNAEWCRNSATQAADVFYGYGLSSKEANECQRPSVKALCDALEPDVVALKKGRKK